MAAPPTLVQEQLCGACSHAITAQVWSADGELLAMATAGGELLRIDFRAGCEELLRGEQRSATGSAGLSLGWSGQGNLLASGQLDGSLMLWPDGGGGRGWQFRGFPGKARALTWCDQPGRLAPLLAVASADIALLWSQQDRGAKGWKPEPLVLHEGRVHAVAFAPGSSLLATASGDGTVASRASGGSGP